VSGERKKINPKINPKERRLFFSRLLQKKQKANKKNNTPFEKASIIFLTKSAFYIKNIAFHSKKCMFHSKKKKKKAAVTGCGTLKTKR
jgi:hypothetical protein